ncbi:MAG: hypothetical protein M3511_02070 [Deinococcota bacterium]|jgi:hypothetical protein|nr:hypothetical protein [Deinococcota bacterium]
MAWDDVRAGVKAGLRALRRRSQEGARQTKLRLDKSSLQRKKTRLLTRLGRDALALHKRGLHLHDSLEPVLTEILRLEGEISRKEEAIRRVAPEEAALTPEASQGKKTDES